MLISCFLSLQISQLNTVLEDTQYRLAIAESRLETAENEKLQAVGGLKEQVHDHCNRYVILVNLKQI